MTEYELINPSDPYTFEAEDFETAALVCFIMGSGYYGAEPKDGGEEVPIFIFGGAESWYKATFGTTFEESIDDPEKVARLSKALASMMLGDFEDRAKYNAALEAIDDPEKRAAFIDEWQGRCSSLNDIGGRAHKLAQALAATANTKEGAQ